MTALMLLFQSHFFPQLKQTICSQLTVRARRGIIPCLTCLLTTSRAPRDWQLKHTQCKRHKAFHLLKHYSNNTTVAWDFTKKLLLQDFVFATCRTSVDTWAQTMSSPEAAPPAMKKRATGRLMVRWDTTQSKISCWLICMKSPTGVVLLSVFICLKEPMYMPCRRLLYNMHPLRVCADCQDMSGGAHTEPQTHYLQMFHTDDH